MGSLLANHTDSRDNNFNLLRFLAAGMVLLGHSYPLTGLEHEPLFGGRSLGYVAVDIFFVTSGLLVTRSLLTRSNVIAFAWARFVRIYPALIVAVLLCAIPLGLAFTTESTGDYLKDGQVAKFILKNATLVLGSVVYELPGVFENNPYPDAVNGSLWTLPWEIRMYAVLGLLGVFSLVLPKAKRVPVIRIAVVALAILFSIATIHHQWNGWAASHKWVTGLRLGAMFFIGGAYYVLRRYVSLNHWAVLAILIAMFVWRDAPRVFPVLYIAFLGYLVLYIAYIPGGFLRRFNNLGDYSYGLYIYAFPVQQGVAALIPDVGVMTMFAVSTVITLVLAIASWYLLEKPLLRQKDAYKRFVPVAWTKD